MKVKDIERTANIAWSPPNQYPILLAAGTAAQQLDASFNTNALLEIYELNLNEPGLDVEVKASVTSEQRFHKIVWGPQNVGGDSGVIVGGCDSGLLQIYNAQKLLRNESSLMSKQDKHTGPVHALDFNPFQSNLLATGATESEIFIWDMNHTGTPMTPGAKSQPLEDVLSIAWNRQVQHILASTFTTKCVVWDLRKNEPIIKLSDTVSRIRWKVVAWHPEVATQLCLASEDDQAPIIQLWDLRFATSPLKIMENHQRGVLSIAWCAQDPDLLISCGKDNRIICWNPNSNQPNGEMLSEIARTNQWNFDVSWCPRNPALIASPSFDGHVSIYSLMGGKTQQIQTTNKIADSFPGMDGYIQAPVQQQGATAVSVDLSKPPKWLKRPVGASFGFGGKLITFENNKHTPDLIRSVTISQVITEPELVRKSMELEQALEYGNFKDYCLNKADSTNNQHKKYIWHFLKAQFEENSRFELLNLLGYKIEDVNAKLSQHVDDNNVKTTLDGLANQFSNLNKQTNLYDDPDTNISSNGSPDFMPGNYIDSELNDFDSIAQTNKKHLEPYVIKTGNDTEGLIAQALILGNVEAAVELCLSAKRFADAIIIAMTGGSDLLAKTQLKYFQQSDGYLSSLISALVSEDWASVVNNCDINSWKEALAAVLTHSSDEELPLLCQQMGNRLERESNGNVKLEQDAQLCYICAGNFDRLVASWSGDAKKSSNDLQELVELVTFLQKAVERQGRQVEINGHLADLLSYYASLLASQGNLQTALNYLGSSQNETVKLLRERLFVSLGQKPTYNQGQTNRRSSGMRQSFSNYFNQPQTNNYNTGLPNPPVQQQQPWNIQATAGYQQMPPKTFSPAPNVPLSTQPPRPTSVGSTHGPSGITSRSKYVVDPSVQTNQYGGSRNQFAPNPMLPPQPIPQFQANPQLTNPYAPSMFNQPAVVNPPVASFPPTPTHGGFQNQPTFGNEPKQPSAEVGQPAVNYLAASNTPPGWNDPPALHKSQKMQSKQEQFTPQEPIMHPLYGTTPAQNNGYVDQTQPPPFNQQSPLYGQQPPQSGPQLFQPPLPSTGAYGQHVPAFNTQAVSHVGFNQNAVNTPQQQIQQERLVEKPQPVQKLPIPEEHIHMQTVLDELRKQCSCTTNNPQTKRKLEDVAKKLEILYDLLREHKLTTNTLTLLHQMVQLIQNGDYSGGLNLHTQLVSGPDFAQIATFMPGVKVLLQCALQLQVYLR